MMAEHVPQKDGAVRATAPAQGERDPSIHQDSCGLKLLPPRTLLRIGESNSRNIRCLLLPIPATLEAALWQ